MQPYKDIIKTLSEKINYQKIREIVDELEKEENFSSYGYEEAKKWFKEEILKKVSIHQDHCESYSDSLLFFLNDELIMEEENKQNSLVVSSRKIWEILETKFSLDNREISKLIKETVKEHFKISVSEPIKDKILSSDLIEEYCNIKSKYS